MSKKMPRILSIDNSVSFTKDNIFISFWESFLSVGIYDKLMLIVVFLIIAVTPYFVINNQIFTSKAGTITDNYFYEPFTFQGDHAATLGGGTGTTVWWNANDWDTRGDTANNPIECPGADIPCKGNHIDVHLGKDDLNDGTRVNDRYVINGDGSPGVATMHLDFEAIQSGRLRNPMLISSDNPGIVEFRTTNFVTTGHWWEIAIAPTNIVVGGENTSVPSPGDGTQGFAGNPGAGHFPPEDSINFISHGGQDASCTQFITGISKAIGGVKTEYLGDFIPTSSAEKDKLFKWQLKYYPDRIEVFRDTDGDGTVEPFDVFNVTVPWSEVYVTLLGVAYQADHHPQGSCFQWQIREIPWKEVKVGPVKYAKTKAYPKEIGTSKIPMDTGWVGYDTRDTQRFGVVNGVKQPNAGAYSKHTSNAFCSVTGSFTCASPTSSKMLSFDLSAEDLARIARAQLIYDTKL